MKNIYDTKLILPQSITRNLPQLNEGENSIQNFDRV